MNNNEKLKELRQIKKQLLVDIKKLKSDKNKEIQETLRLIEEKYKSLITEKEELFYNADDDICDYCLTVEKYSTFKGSLICDILQKLMTIYEGKDFIARKISYQINGTLFYDGVFILEKEKYKNLKSKSTIKKTDIVELLKNNYGIRLMEDFSLKNQVMIPFYCKNATNNICQSINFGSFDYLKRFIYGVVNYRLENKKDEITPEELEILMNEFIYNNKEEIQEKYDFLVEESTKKFQESLEFTKMERNSQLQRVLKKHDANASK